LYMEFVLPDLLLFSILIYLVKYFLMGFSVVSVS
jgi:hypothetical protein